MNISIINRQRRLRFNRRRLITLASFFMEKASAMNTRKSWVECSIVIVGEKEMIRINKQVLNHAGTTDVITLAYPTSPGEQPSGWRGELIVNIDEAQNMARQLGHPLLNELALYIAHGCQHLGGADDATPRERAAMSRRQLQWLKLAGI